LSLFQVDFIFVEYWQSVYSSPSEVAPLSGTAALISTGNPSSNTSLDHTLLFFWPHHTVSPSSAFDHPDAAQPSSRTQDRRLQQALLSLRAARCALLLPAARNLKPAAWRGGYPGNIPYPSLLSKQQKNSRLKPPL